jgi:hypothetical protein
MQDQDTKAKFREIMGRCDMSVRDLAELAQYSPKYVHKIIYTKSLPAPRWMRIVVGVVNILEKSKKNKEKV